MCVSFATGVRSRLLLLGGIELTGDAAAVALPDRQSLSLSRFPPSHGRCPTPRMAEWQRAGSGPSPQAEGLPQAGYASFEACPGADGCASIPTGGSMAARMLSCQQGTLYSAALRGPARAGHGRAVSVPSCHVEQESVSLPLRPAGQPPAGLEMKALSLFWSTAGRPGGLVGLARWGRGWPGPAPPQPARRARVPRSRQSVMHVPR